MAITEMSARNLVVITQSVEKRSDCSQWICDEAGNVIETHEHKGDFEKVVKFIFFFSRRASLSW
jgi:hypothetical protein